MSIKTTNPVDGTTVSASQWGSAVYQDLSALANIGSITNVVAPSQAISVLTNTSFTNWVMPYTKLLDTSRLQIQATFTCYSSLGTGYGTLFAALIDGVDYDIGFYYWNVVNDHRQVVCVGVVPGLSAGVKTIQLRARNDLAARTISTDTNDRCSIIVEEVP
jgi:hypothetical protein